MTLLCPPPRCRLVRVARDGPAGLVVAAKAHRDHARCPTCRTLSTSVHSRYHQRPADLPVSGKTVRLQLAVRRLYCREPACPRRTFAERFPKLLARHAQRTRRSAEAQVRTGLALGGLPAAQLLAPARGPTPRRRRAPRAPHPLPAPPPPDPRSHAAMNLAE